MFGRVTERKLGTGESCSSGVQPVGRLQTWRHVPLLWRHLVWPPQMRSSMQCTFASSIYTSGGWFSHALKEVCVWFYFRKFSGSFLSQQEAWITSQHTPWYKISLPLNCEGIASSPGDGELLSVCFLWNQRHGTWWAFRNRSQTGSDSSNNWSWQQYSQTQTQSRTSVFKWMLHQDMWVPVFNPAVMGCMLLLEFFSLKLDGDNMIYE